MENGGRMQDGFFQSALGRIHQDMSGTDERYRLSIGIIVVWLGIPSLVTTIGTQFVWPTGGQGYLLPTLPAVFLGGTSVFGRSGTIFGTSVGRYIIVVSVSMQTLLSRRLG